MGNFMQATFFYKIYSMAWKKKQLQKYSDLLPELKKIVPGKTVLDYGIGKAWLWQFLAKKGIKAKEVHGIDLDEEAIKPRKKGIRYYFSLRDFKKKNRGKKVGLLVLFDSMHLLSKKELNELKKIVKKKGVILVSLPESKKGLLHNLNFGRAFWEGKIGKEERDFACLLKHS
jgi:2-polyprenyl-3-methyl-5-hydroxy-6-metoxy-1,4-benzoquinol methylase